jgi:endonuclease YncB( thermonuclease family)
MNQTDQNKLLIISAALIVLSVVFLLIPEPVRTPVPGVDSQKAKSQSDIYVTRIIDGDTFELSDSRTVRLIGVDTPETGMPYYDDAIAFAESLLTGKSVTLEFDRTDRDKYGRYLAYVYFDTNFVNRMLVDRGLATVYLFESNIDKAGVLIESQKRARASDLGIWSLPDPPPEDYYVKVRGSYRFHRPLCMAIKKSNPENREIYRSREDLLDKGYSPCRNCRP